MSRFTPSRRTITTLGIMILSSAAALSVSGGLADVDARLLAINAAPGAANSNGNKKDDKAASGHTTKLKLRVLNNEGKPVGNASVYVRFYTEGGLLHHDKLAELDLKTNQDGSVKVPEIPQGKVLIQVIATGWHTFGKWYDLEKDEESILIKLEPPPHWY